MTYAAIAKPLSRNTIRKMTNKLRERFEISKDEPFPIVEFIELLSVDGQGFNYEILPDEELEGCYAKALPDKNIILIQESVYNGACNGNHRDRFTLAHELGHLLLHETDSISFARSNEKIKAYLDPEWQANTFAGELLVPISEIIGLTHQQISKKYSVSYAVAKIQLQQLN